MTYEEYDMYRKKFKNGETDALYLDINGTISFFVDKNKTSIVDVHYGKPHIDAGKWFIEREIHPIQMDETDFWIFRSTFG
jgi:hypothetical protein